MPPTTGDSAASDPAGEPEPAGAPANPNDPPMGEPASRQPSVGQLRRERRRLWDERQEAVYHLGGLAVDLHRRRMLADELVTRRAELIEALDARMAAIDEQLSGIEDRRRSRRVRVPPPAGYCLSCGAAYPSDAAYCFRCGARIHVPSYEAETQVIAEAETQAIPARESDSP